MFRKTALVIIIVVMALLIGCQQRDNRTTPRGLMGKWKTSAPKYADCAVEICDGLIIFSREPDYVSVNIIKHIERTVREDYIVYTIQYENIQKNEFEFSLMCRQGKPCAEIRFVNQDEIIWRKIEHG